MIKDFLYRSRYYFLLIFFLFLIFISVKYLYVDELMKFDGSVMSYVSNHIVDDKFSLFFKGVTYLGGVCFFVIVLLLILLFVKNKRYFLGMTINLFFTYLLSVVFKNVFRRERPLFNLIDKPSDYAFPSGHTMCSVAFYGLLIYLINKYVYNKVFKVLLIILFSVILLLISFSRLYLNVHYLSDIIGGAVLGVVCLKMFINYFKEIDYL